MRKRIAKAVSVTAAFSVLWGGVPGKVSAQEQTGGETAALTECAGECAEGDGFVCAGNFEVDESLLMNLQKLERELRGGDWEGAETYGWEIPGASSERCPSDGNVRSLVVMVDFEDTKFGEGFTEEYVEQLMFGDPVSAEAAAYPKESMNAWYQRSSYGKLSFSGDIYHVSLGNTREYYTSKDTEDVEERKYWEDLSAAVRALNLDWSKYDLDENHYLDALCLVVAGEVDEWAGQWWSKCIHAENVDLQDEVYAARNIVMCMEEHMGNASTIIHEFGHALGLPDLYDTSEGGGGTERGLYTNDMMSNNAGDFNGLCKMMLGWIGAEQIHKVSYGTALSEVVLNSYTKSGDCALLFLEEGEESIFGEYYLAQYMDFYGNDKELEWAVEKPQLRLYHVNAELDESGTLLLHENRIDGDGDCKLIEAVDQDAEYIHGSRFGEEYGPVFGAIAGESHCGYLAGEEFTPYTTPSSARYAADRQTESAGIFSGLHVSGIQLVGGKASFRASYEDAPSQTGGPEFVSLGTSDAFGRYPTENLQIEIKADRDVWKNSDAAAYIREKGNSERLAEFSVERDSMKASRCLFTVRMEPGKTLKEGTEYEIVFPAGMFTDACGTASKEAFISVRTDMGGEAQWHTVSLDTEKYEGLSNGVSGVPFGVVINEKGNIEFAARGADRSVYICEAERETGNLLTESLVKAGKDIQDGGSFVSMLFGRRKDGNLWVIMMDEDEEKRNLMIHIYIIGGDKKLIEEKTIQEDWSAAREILPLEGDKAALLLSSTYRCPVVDLNSLDSVCISAVSQHGYGWLEEVYTMGENILAVETEQGKAAEYSIRDKENAVLAELGLEGISIVDVLENGGVYEIYGNLKGSAVRYRLNQEFAIADKLVLFPGSMTGIWKLNTGYYYIGSTDEKREGTYLLDAHYNVHGRIGNEYDYGAMAHDMADGREYLVVVWPRSKEEFQYRVTEPFEITQGGENALEKLEMSDKIQPDQNGCVAIETGKEAEFLDEITAVADEVYRVAEVDGQKYLIVSAGEGRAERYFRVVEPTAEPTTGPSAEPTAGPSAEPTTGPSTEPTAGPSAEPTTGPSTEPTTSPSTEPTAGPSAKPTAGPSTEPTTDPSAKPTTGPSVEPTAGPSAKPTAGPGTEPTTGPSAGPTTGPSTEPTTSPSTEPTAGPSAKPTAGPSTEPTAGPSAEPTAGPDTEPTAGPGTEPTPGPGAEPTAEPPAETGDLVYSEGNYYFYENGEMAVSKEAFVDGAWRWFEEDGEMAVDKDVYQLSYAGSYADREDGTGKWVRYDENGRMIKGVDYRYGGWYRFDEETGAMVKGWYGADDGNTYYYDWQTGQRIHGEYEADGAKCYFDEETGIAADNVWVSLGEEYWYEGGVRQGTEGRGKEIYDPASDAWYWLDAVDQGKKAVGKDVYQESYSAYPDREDGTGKWVRYDGQGHMVKGWQTTEAGTYYFEEITGAMAKGHVVIDGTAYEFDTVTGILKQPAHR